MIQDIIKGNRDIQGLVRLHRVTDTELWTPTTRLRGNKLLYEWGAIVGRLLTVGDRPYRISGMYLEFANVANPGDKVTPVAVERDRTVDYYGSLTATGGLPADYIWAPLIASQLLSSDSSVYPKGNLPVFFARSQAVNVRGLNDTPLGVDNNSTFYSAALVACTDENDRTKDLILSAFNFESAEQQPKLATSQVGLEWQLILQ